MDRSCTILVMLLLVSIQSVSSGCSFTSVQARWIHMNAECVALYECSSFIGSIVDDVEPITAICLGVYVNSNCDDAGHCIRHLRFSEKFRLRVKGVNITAFDHSLSNIYYNITGYKYLIDEMTLINSDLTLIPEELFNLSHLRVLDVSHNKINKTDLRMCLAIETLNIFNASYNVISELETKPLHYRFDSNMTVIDLSHNAIEIIPDNYFSNFAQLFSLNMSHNMINNLNIISFEGLSELETLKLSNNRIKHIGMTFVRFSNLKELALDHNNLSEIEENNFKMLTRLTTLNLSFNKIISIDSLSFKNMTNLQSLQLNDNNIEVITKTMFSGNNALQEVNFANNNIHKLDPFSFKGTNITICYFRNNALTTLDDKSIFDGISVEELDLSNSKINSIGNNVFEDLSSKLRTLNLSSNLISHINENSFRALESLTELDLSNNKLPNIEFDMSGLTNLIYFYAKNNRIKKLSKNIFRQSKSLKKVNLSNNDITEIEIFSFYELGRVEVLDLSNNDLVSVIAPFTFQGLSSTQQLFLMHSKISSLQNAAFYTMVLLNHLNASWSVIESLEYNVFNGTGNICTLDLSHNRIKIFNVNQTHLKHVEKIYLNDNQIESLTNQTFCGLNNLQILNLNNNNILLLDIESFRSLHKITSLDLSSNVNMMFDASALANISTLMFVGLHNVWKPFNFDNAINISISELDLSSSNITDVNSVMIYKLTKLETLLLNSNKIKSIDRYSFQNLSSLIYLDLSNNLISTIKPGSFIDTSEMAFLNLHNNNLVSLTFGVFDGLTNLRVLNLSSNALQSFHGRLFHNSHRLSVVSLDDNRIEIIDFNELKVATIPKVTIGGNLITCDLLAMAKKNKFYGVIVTSEKLNYHVENVDGVSCKGLHKVTNPDGQRISINNTDQVDIEEEHNLGSLQIVNNQLDTIKTALYFEASCLLTIVCLLFVSLSYVYVKLKKKLIRTYSVNSRRYLTDGSMDMELYRTS